MPLVVDALPLSGGAEGLTWTRACPHRPSPSCEIERIGPSADPGEEVALIVFSDIFAPYVLNGSGIYVALRDKAVRHEFAQPRRCELVVLVVIDLHAIPSNNAFSFSRRCNSALRLEPARFQLKNSSAAPA